jgi:phage terminase large subunit-like protein
MTISNRLPGIITAKGKSLYSGTRKVFLVGTNVAYLAVNWGTPEEFALKFSRLGYNWLRFHHVDDLIRKGQVTVERLLSLCDACHALGMVVSIDGISQYAAYTKTSLYEGQNWAEYSAYLTRIAPVLRHPACFMFCAVNEELTDLKNKSLTHLIVPFHQKVKAFVRELGFNGLFTDGGDANIDPPLFAPLMSECDIVVAHTYGRHPVAVAGGTKFRRESWPYNHAHAGVTLQLQGLVNVPVVVQEYGCLEAEDAAMNEAYYVAEARDFLSGMCIYQHASNVAEMRGDEAPVSGMSTSNNPARSIAACVLALMAKYGAGPVLSKWYAKSPPSDVYKRVTAKTSVDINRKSGRIVVEPSAKKRIVILMENQQIAGRVLQDNGDSWFTITSRGTNRFGYMEAGWIEMGAEIAYVNRLNHYTLENEASCRVSGTRFWAPSGLAIYEVTIK